MCPPGELKSPSWPPRLDGVDFQQQLKAYQRDELRAAIRLGWLPACANFEKAIQLLGYESKRESLTDDEMNAALDKTHELFALGSGETRSES